MERLENQSVYKNGAIIFVPIRWSINLLLFLFPQLLLPGDVKGHPMLGEMKTSVLNASFNQKRHLLSDKYINNHVGDVSISEAHKEAIKRMLDP